MHEVTFAHKIEKLAGKSGKYAQRSHGRAKLRVQMFLVGAKVESRIGRLPAIY